MGKFIDLTSRRFEKLFVISQANKPTCYRGHGTRWFCKCDCGKLLIVFSSNLIEGKNKSCGCWSRTNKFNGYKDLTGTFWSRIRNGARKRKLEFAITKEYVWDLYEKQNRKCALSGLPILISKDFSQQRCNQTASLDRIDNSKGYIEGNVQWVLQKINFMKFNLCEKEFIELCRKIINYYDKQT